MLLYKLSSIIIVTASLLLGGRVTARKDDSNQISHLRGNGNEITFTASSASLPPEQPSVKIRTMPNSPFRIFTRQGTSNTARDDNNNNDEIVEQISVWDSTTNTTTQYNIPPPPKSPPLEYDNENLLPPCPETYNPQQLTNYYVAGNKVEVYDTIFTCRPSPYEEYCNIHSLEEAILLSKNGDYIAPTINKRTGFNNHQDGEMNSNSQQQLSEEEQVTELWLNAWMEVGKCIHSTTTMPEQEQNTAAASTEPTVLPTYWPTYSPSNYFPTALPTSIP